MVPPSETPLSPEDIARIKESTELRATAFRSRIEQVIRQLDRISGLKFNSDIEPGYPDSEELERLLKLGDAIAYSRGKLIFHDDSLCTLLNQYTDYCVRLPEAHNIADPFIKECNEYCASARLLNIQDALKQKLGNLQQLIETCTDNVRTLRKRIADAEADAAQFGDTEHGSSSTRQPKTGSTTGQTNDGNPSTAGTSGNPLPSSRSEMEDIAPLRPSQPPSSGPRSPLRYTATGSPTPGLSAAGTGADFSRFGSNPFYVNSTVKLPLRSSVGTPTGKEPSPPPLSLSALPIKPFDGDPRQYPRFRDAFIRMVHAPGRHLDDIDLLDFLLHSLKSDPHRFAESYGYSGGDSYHRITAQLEHRYYDPAVARRLLEKELDDMRPVNNHLSDLQRYADDWMRVCGELLSFRENILDNSAYYKRFMEKLPHPVRLELFRNEHEYKEFSLEAAIIELQEALKCHRKANAFRSPDGEPKQSTGNPGGSRLKALTNGGLKIELLEENKTGGFMSAAKGPRVAVCCFCNTKGKHWPSHCTVYNTAERRRQRAREIGLCFQCLWKGHDKTNTVCRLINVGLCVHCGQYRHHKAFCTDYANRNKRPAAEDRRQHMSETQGCRPAPGQYKLDREPTNRQTGGTYSPGAEVPSKGVEDGQPGRRKAAYRKAPKPRRVPANLAAGDANEDSIDGSKACSKPTVGPPGPSSVADRAAPLKAAVDDRVPVQPSKFDEELDELGHCSDAPTEPDSDSEEYALGLRPPDGVGKFGANAPHADIRRTHLLECVQAEVCKRNLLDEKKRVTVFFDCGSSCTYVTKQLASDLGLINLGADRLQLDTFASDAPVRLDIYKTRLAIRLADGQLCHLDASASPKLRKIPYLPFL